MSEERFVAIAATLHEPFAAGFNSIANMVGGLGAGEAAQLETTE